ncbi:uncharacterized protein LOC135079671 [Ostrinia nubilalis]|uniref:uncharacterized protein LOC135079671 n=1 Tax=Ostrinia nubilalis TaxID=29057 RepID=UPI00308224D8
MVVLNIHGELAMAVKMTIVTVIMLWCLVQSVHPKPVNGGLPGPSDISYFHIIDAPSRRPPVLLAKPDPAEAYTPSDHIIPFTFDDPQRDEEEEEATTTKTDTSSTKEPESGGNWIDKVKPFIKWDQWDPSKWDPSKWDPTKLIPA